MGAIAVRCGKPGRVGEEHEEWRHGTFLGYLWSCHPRAPSLPSPWPLLVLPGRRQTDWEGQTQDPLALPEGVSRCSSLPPFPNRKPPRPLVSEWGGVYVFLGVPGSPQVISCNPNLGQTCGPFQGPQVLRCDMEEGTEMAQTPASCAESLEPRVPRKAWGPSEPPAESAP